MIEPKYLSRFEMIVEYYEVNGRKKESQVFQEEAIRLSSRELESFLSSHENLVRNSNKLVLEEIHNYD